MSIYEALETNNEQEVLLATAQKLAEMLDALPNHRTRDAAPLALQIKQICERMSDLEPPVLDEEAEEARATVTFLQEQRRKRAS